MCDYKIFKNKYQCYTDQTQCMYIVLHVLANHFKTQTGSPCNCVQFYICLLCSGCAVSREHSSFMQSIRPKLVASLLQVTRPSLQTSFNTVLSIKGQRQGNGQTQPFTYENIHQTFYSKCIFVQCVIELRPHVVLRKHFFMFKKRAIMLKLNK